MKFQINNVLIDVTYSYQTKLEEPERRRGVETSQKYNYHWTRRIFLHKIKREFDTWTGITNIPEKRLKSEKIFHSLKNEIEIKPLRVWSEHSIYGALIIGFIAQLFISLIRYEHKEPETHLHKIHKKKPNEFDSYSGLPEKHREKCDLR